MGIIVQKYGGSSVGTVDKIKISKKLDFIDYEEILELSSLGAQVMH